MIIILHNEQSGASRHLTSAAFESDEIDLVIDWYNESSAQNKQDYLNGNNPSPSAFPSVVNTKNKRIIAMPESLQDALDYVNERPTREERLEAVESALVDLLGE